MAFLKKYLTIQSLNLTNHFFIGGKINIGATYEMSSLW
jgi:hypothetical protein